MNERNVPEVRFRGFSGEWEKYIFTDFIERKSIISNEIGLPRVEYEDIIPEFGRLNKDIYKKESEKAGILFESGDILFGKLRPYLKNWLITDFSGIAVGDFWILKPTTIGDFVYYLIQSSRFQYVANLSSGTKMPRSDWKIVSKYEFQIAADANEQTKIGEFFKNLDNLITQNQKKHDKLVNMKKACLDKMFPKDGADTPEVRFRGFSGGWEKKILEAISLNTYGGGTPNTSINEFWSGYIPWIQSSDLIEHDVSSILVRKKISNLAVSKSATKIIPKDSIAVVTRVGVGKLAVIPFQYATSQDFLSLSDLTVDKLFVVYSLYRKLQNELQQVQGTSIKGITKDELLKKSLLVSQSTTEQTKIGTFFQTLDTLITAQKTKLEKLKNIKKACLDKMFV